MPCERHPRLVGTVRTRVTVDHWGVSVIGISIATYFLVKSSEKEIHQLLFCFGDRLSRRVNH